MDLKAAWIRWRIRNKYADIRGMRILLNRRWAAGFPLQYLADVIDHYERQVFVLEGRLALHRLQQKVEYRQLRRRYRACWRRIITQYTYENLLPLVEHTEGYFEVLRAEQEAYEVSGDST
jgi:hypothetical protein